MEYIIIKYVVTQTNNQTCVNNIAFNSQNGGEGLAVIKFLQFKKASYSFGRIYLRFRRLFDKYLNISYRHYRRKKIQPLHPDI